MKAVIKTDYDHLERRKRYRRSPVSEPFQQLDAIKREVTSDFMEQQNGINFSRIKMTKGHN